MESAELTGC